jgi:hypothetical protein
MRKAAKVIAKMIVLYRDVMGTFLTPEELGEVDALADCCANFLNNVPNDRPYDPV